MLHNQRTTTSSSARSWPRHHATIGPHRRSPALPLPRPPSRHRPARQWHYSSDGPSSSSPASYSNSPTELHADLAGSLPDPHKQGPDLAPESPPPPDLVIAVAQHHCSALHRRQQGRGRKPRRRLPCSRVGIPATCSGGGEAEGSEEGGLAAWGWMPPVSP